MDPIIIPTVPLIPGWMEQLLTDCEAEAVANAQWPIKVLGKSARKFIWNLCVTLGVQNHGVAGQACRLSEQYLASRIREMSHVPSVILMDEEFRAEWCLFSGSPEWQQFKRALAVRLPLIITLVIQLCAKVANVSVALQPHTIKSALMLKGAVYTVEDILASEFEVLKTLQFRLPLWTSVETAELLATEVGMSAELMPGLTLIVNLAEFYRYRLEADVRDVVGIPDPFAKIRMRTLHLIAGAVSASARFLRYQGLDPALKLATLTRAPHCYIVCIADLVLRCIEQEEKTAPLSRKRKLMSSM